MEFIEQLKNLQLFKSEMDILDVGCRNGWLFKRIQKPGTQRNYDGVDLKDMIDDKSSMRFFKESFDTFIPDKQYDLIFARSVFFFHPDQIGQARRYVDYLKPRGVMCASFMFEDDPHVGKTEIYDGAIWYGVTQKSIDQFLSDYEILWLQDFNQKNIDFDKNLKDWHLCNVILRKR